MPNPVNIARNQITPIVIGCTGTGVAASAVFQKVFEVTGSPGQLVAGLVNVVDDFTGLQFNLEFTTSQATPNWEVVKTWTPLTDGVGYFPISEAGFYRLNCVDFEGGTSVDVQGTVGLPAGLAETGGAGPTADVTLVGSTITLPVSITGQPIDVHVVGETTGAQPTYSVGSGNNLIIVGATFIPILSIQPQSGSQATTFTLQILDLSGNGATVQYQLVRNATLTGASFSAVNGTSLMNFDTAATVSSGGLVVDEGVYSLGPKQIPYATVGFSFSGSTGDIFTVLAAGINGAPGLVAAAFRWIEA